MNIKGKLIQLLDLQTGIGKNGQWKKQDIILEIEGTYPKKICMSIWGDKINEKELVIGNQLVIDFDLESREYNGKWYTDVRVSRIVSEDNQITQDMTNSFLGDLSSNHSDNNEDLDLPF